MAKKGRKNKKGNRNQTTNKQVDCSRLTMLSDSEADDVASTISFARSTSEFESEKERNNSDEEDTESDWLYISLDEKIDDIMDRRQQLRSRGLQELREILLKHFLDEELTKRSETLFSALAQILRRGSSISERKLASNILALTILQFSALDCYTDEMTVSIFETCIPLISDRSQDSNLRCDYIDLLTCATLIDENDFERIRNLVTQLFHIFIEESVQILQITAVTCWSMVLNQCLAEDTSFMAPYVSKFISHACRLMSSSSIELRIAVGQALCVIAEINENNLSDSFKIPEQILDAVRSLSTESTKKISKRGKCELHVNFRKIKKYLEESEFITNEVAFDGEFLKIDCWIKSLQYSFFNHLLGSKFSEHLKNNPVIRNMLGLPEIPISFKLSRSERSEMKLLHKMKSTYRSKHIESLRTNKWDAYGLNDTD